MQIDLLDSFGYQPFFHLPNQHGPQTLAAIFFAHRHLIEPPGFSLRAKENTAYRVFSVERYQVKALPFEGEFLGSGIEPQGLSQDIDAQGTFQAV